MAFPVLVVILCKKCSTNTDEKQEDKVYTNDNETTANTQITWKEFYSRLRTCNGQKIDGETFWIYSRKKISLGAHTYEITQFDITDDKFIIQGLDFIGNTCFVSGSLK